MSDTPFFGKFGKKASDLFKANKFDKNVEIVHKTANGGPKVTTTGVANPGKPFSGKMKFNMTDKELGGDIELTTSTSGDVSGKLTLKNLLTNLKITLSGGVSKGSVGEEISAEYRQDMFAATAALSASEASKNGKPQSKLDASLAFGDDGWSAGGSASFQVAEGTEVAFDVLDYNLGMCYEQADFTGAFSTKKSMTEFNLRYFHKVSATHRMGAQFVASPSDGAYTQSMSFCSEFDANDNTTVKTTADTSGLVVHKVTHTLANPAVKLSGSAGFQVTAGDVFNISPGKLDKLGLTVSLGDF